MVPKNTVHVEGKDAEAVLKLVESLEELDDVQKVWANFDIDVGDMAGQAGRRGAWGAGRGAQARASRARSRTSHLPPRAPSDDDCPRHRPGHRADRLRRRLRRQR